MNKKLKKSLSAALICAMMLTVTAPVFSVSAYADNTSASTTASKSYKITKKSIKTYLFDKFGEKTNLYFVNGSDVPYMKIDDFAALYKYAGSVGLEVDSFDIKVVKKDNQVLLQRENGYYSIIDFSDEIIYFVDYNAFIEPTGKLLMNLIGRQEKRADGTYKYTKILSSSNQQFGDSVTLNFGEYDIDLVHAGNDYYIPLQTLSDVFLAPISINLLYNGKVFILYHNAVTKFLDSTGYTDIGKAYYDDSVMGKISKDMAKYNYNELCFAFDYLYGLKDAHGIKSFSNLVKQRGMEHIFLGTDPKKIDAAIYRIINENLDDIHSLYNLPSYATGLKALFEISEKYPNGRSKNNLYAKRTELMTARAKYYPEGVPGYEEVGDTAFITLDQFTPKAQDYYYNKPTAESADTMGIIAYSVQQILRKESPIKNVVLDVSCNTGGTAETAVYTLGAMLGKASVSIADTTTGALATYDFKVDTNFDGKFNSKDNLADKGLNLYCLMSGVSFSCGNLVPCAFKNSGRVTLIGQTSGGGSCTVIPMTTALGTIFNLSSQQRLSFLKNGSFYDVDRGADPDIYFSKAESYYDREGLVEYIHSIK